MNRTVKFGLLLLLGILIFRGQAFAANKIEGVYVGSLSVSSSDCTLPETSSFSDITLSIAATKKAGNYKVTFSSSSIGSFNLNAVLKGTTLYIDESKMAPSDVPPVGKIIVNTKKNIATIVETSSMRPSLPCDYKISGVVVKSIAGKPTKLLKPTATPKPTKAPKATAVPTAVPTATSRPSPTSTPEPASIVGTYILGAQTANNKVPCLAKSGTILAPQSFKVLDAVNAGYDYYVILSSGQSFNATFKAGTLSLIQIVYPTVGPVIVDPGNADPGIPVASPPKNAIKASINIKFPNASLGAGFTTCAGFNNNYMKK